MNREIKLTQNNLRLWYFRYKDSPYFSLAVIILVISISLILFFKTIVPQVQSWLSVREEVLRTREKISNINSNITLMNDLDKNLLKEQVEIATAALPIEKDFGSIINALSDSAANAGVGLNDYNFQVGNVASSEGKFNLYGQKDLSTIRLTISLSGNIENIGLFLKQIQEKIPLSEVTDVDGDTSATIITIQFFQKQFPVIIYKDNVPISPLSASHLALIKKMSSWQPALAQEEQVATESAVSVPLF